MEKALKLPLSAQEIKQVLPHRFPFLFVDEITEFEDRVFIVGKKYVLAQEPHFAGHFPGRPIMPGVLILEAMAQLAALFAKLSTGGVAAEKLIVFAGADKVRFRRPVYPGDVLTIRMENHKQRGPFWQIEGSVFVGEVRVADAVLKANVID